MTTARIATTPLKSSQLKPGQIVHFYGARFRLADDRRVWDRNEERPVYTITGDWIDGEVIGGYFGPETPWTFQGNDLATRHVELGFKVHETRAVAGNPLWEIKRVRDNQTITEPFTTYGAALSYLQENHEALAEQYA